MLKRFVFTNKETAQNYLEHYYTFIDNNKLLNINAFIIHHDKFIINSDEITNEEDIINLIFSEGYALDIFFYNSADYNDHLKEFEVVPKNPKHKILN